VKHAYGKQKIVNIYIYRPFNTFSLHRMRASYGLLLPMFAVSQSVCPSRERYMTSVQCIAHTTLT